MNRMPVQFPGKCRWGIDHNISFGLPYYFVCNSFNIDKGCNSDFCRCDELSLLFQSSLSRRVWKQHNSRRYHHMHLYLMHVIPHSHERFSAILCRHLQMSCLQSIRKFAEDMDGRVVYWGIVFQQLWMCCFYKILHDYTIGLLLQYILLLLWLYEMSLDITTFFHKRFSICADNHIITILTYYINLLIYLVSCWRNAKLYHRQHQLQKVVV